MIDNGATDGMSIRREWRGGLAHTRSRRFLPSSPRSVRNTSIPPVPRASRSRGIQAFVERAALDARRPTERSVSPCASGPLSPPSTDDAVQCDDYMVPNKRPPSAKGESNPPIKINDERMYGTIDVCDQEGHIVERMEAHRFRF